MRKVYGAERIDRLTKIHPTMVVENRVINPAYDQIVQEARTKKDGLFSRLFGKRGNQ